MSSVSLDEKLKLKRNVDNPGEHRGVTMFLLTIMGVFTYYMQSEFILLLYLAVGTMWTFMLLNEEKYEYYTIGEYEPEDQDSVERW